MKGAPYAAIESTLYLLELGMSPDAPIVDVAELLFSTWQKDGRFRVFPKGAMYPCQTAWMINVPSHLRYLSDDRCQGTLQYFLDTQQIEVSR